jgi:hypothetical protein
MWAAIHWPTHVEQVQYSLRPSAKPCGMGTILHQPAHVVRVQYNFSQPVWYNYNIELADLCGTGTIQPQLSHVEWIQSPLWPVLGGPYGMVHLTERCVTSDHELNT